MYELCASFVHIIRVYQLCYSFYAIYLLCITLEISSVSIFVCINFFYVIRICVSFLSVDFYMYHTMSNILLCLYRFRVNHFCELFYVYHFMSIMNVYHLYIKFDMHSFCVSYCVYHA